MGMFNTKVFLEIQIMGYPTGKRIKCHFYLEGNVTREKVNDYINNSLRLSDEYKDYPVNDIKVHNLYITNTKNEADDFGNIILDSVSNAVGEVEKKETKKDVRKINLKDYTDADIEYVRKKMSEELVMRRYNLLQEEFNFYVANQQEIDIEDAKDAYKRYDGDIFKLRKEKIRENIANMLENKKVVD